MKGTGIRKKGKTWLDEMPIEVQQKWHKKMDEQEKDISFKFKKFKLNKEATLYEFIYGSFSFNKDDADYWDSISIGNYDTKYVKKSLWSKIINFFKI